MSNRLRPSLRLSARLRRLRALRTRVSQTRAHAAARAEKTGPPGKTSTSRRTLSPLRRLHPLLSVSRLGHLHMPRTRRGRILWLLSPLVIACLTILVVRRVATPAVDVEMAVRRRALPTLAKSLGMPIEIGHIDTDYLSRVVLHDVVIGRDKPGEKTPFGAHLRASRVTLALDFLGLIQGKDPLSALRSVTIDSPSAWIERDAAGHTNWDVLLKKRTGPTAAWTGRVIVRGGRLAARDTALRNARGEALTAEVSAVDATVDVAPEATAFQVNAPRATIGLERAAIDGIVLDGRVFPGDAKRKPWLASGIRWRNAPLPVLAGYAFPRGDVVLGAGLADGALLLSYDGALAAPRGLVAASGTAASPWLASGRVDLRAVAGAARALRAPGSQTLPFTGLSGPLQFTGTAARTTGLTLQVLGSPLRVSGTAAFVRGRGPSLVDGLDFDAVLESRALNTARLIAAAGPLVPRGLALRSGLARTTLRLTGTPRAFTARGRALAPDAAVHTPTANARLQAPDVTLAFDSRTRRVVGTLAAALLDGGGAPGSGRARGFTTDFALTPGAATGAIQLRAKFAAAGWNARIAAPNAVSANGKNARGAVSWAGDTSAKRGDLALRLSAGAATVNVARLGALRAATGRGALRELIVRAVSHGGKRPAAIDATLDNWAVSGRYLADTRHGGTRSGALRGRTVRLLAQNPDVAPGRAAGNWKGTVSVGGVAANEIQLASLAPEAAQALRQADVSLPGQADALVNFDWRAGRAPVAEGQLHLSRARISGQDVRDVRVNGRYDGARWNLALTRANSAYGALAGWARGGGGAAASFALDVPRLQVPAALVNNLLAPQGLAVSGAATARLSVVPAATGLRAVQTRFTVTLPQGSVRALPRVAGAGPAPLARLENATVRGEGLLTLGPAAPRGALPAAQSGWRFVGSARLSAARVLLSAQAAPGARVQIPQTLRGSALRGLNLQLRGSLAPEDFATGVRLISARPAAPLAGELTWVRAVWPFGVGPAPLAPTARSGPAPALILGEGRALFVRDANGWRVPRFAARVFSDGAGQPADAGRVRGWASLQTAAADRGAVAGQVLMERLDAARLQGAVQSALGARARLSVRLRGTAFARLDVSGTMDRPIARMDARLANGALETAGRTLPLDSARARLDFDKGVTVRDAVLWSRGARLAVSGTAMPGLDGGSDLVLKLTASADSLRLSDAAALVTNTKSELDGLASGRFQIGGTLARPRLDGSAALKLATAYGVTVEEATARVHYENTADGPRIAVEDIEGHSGTTRLTGRFLGDAPADQWRFALASAGLDTARVLRAGQRASNGNNVVALPLRGEMAVQIDVRGRFGENFALVPLEGGAQVRAAGLHWRGRDLGAFNLDATLDGQHLRVEDLSLRDPDNPDTPTLVVSGSVPLTAEEDGLDMHVEARRARLELLRAGLEEVRRTIRDNAATAASPPSISLANSLDTLLRSWDALPQRLDGEAGMTADFSGSLVAPVADVTASLREAKLGGQPLPTLDAAFHLENGAATIKTLELKQTEPAAGGDDEPRETTLRFTPGGRITTDEISLDGELLNANLSQLAPWVGTLRNAAGNALLQGEVSLFNFQLRGTPTAPSLTGSLEAQNLEYRAYTLDRLRLARFEIRGDVLAVEPGNLTVVKGGFQSSAPWGRLPWNWGRGVDFDRPLDVHLPVERRDFGALAGAFLPAIRAADAEGFDGGIDIGGTLSQPRFTGELQLKRARFATDASTGVDIGVRELSGALRFGEDNTLQLDNLRGELARAADVDATATGNLPASERNPARVPNETAKDSHFAGAFALNGTVALRLDPANFSSAPRFVEAQRYDVSLNISKGEFWSKDISGVRDVSLDLAWKTGTGAEETAQRLTWQLSAAGRDAKGSGDKARGSAAGTARSAGTALLDVSDVTKTRWNGTMTLRAFAFNVVNTAAGKLDGDLEFVNMVPHRAAAVAADFSRDGFSLASLEERLRLSRVARRAARDGGAYENKSETASKTVKVPGAARPQIETEARVAPTLAAQLPPVPRGDAALPPAAPAEAADEPISAAAIPGIRGSLVLSETEITGAPVGTVGVARLMPPVPAFDIRLLLGRTVRFVSPTLRAEFAGGMQISGTPREPSLVGTLLARDGQIRFPAASARITTAEVDVNIANDPNSGLVRSSANIDATARGQAGRYAITLHVRGPLDFGSNNAQQLSIEVTSNPPLSQDEAFARLTGTSIRDLQNAGAPTSAENEAYASAFLSVLSAPLFSGIERSLEDALGLSNITLDYRLSEPLSVQFGKAVGDRVYVSYRRSITGNTPGAPTSYELRVDYRIKGDFQLGLQTDERNQRQITLEKTFRF